MFLYRCHGILSVQYFVCVARRSNAVITRCDLNMLAVLLLFFTRLRTSSRSAHDQPKNSVSLDRYILQSMRICYFHQQQYPYLKIMSVL
jgi:hypothetical protein